MIADSPGWPDKRGQRHEIGLGCYPIISLQDARTKAVLIFEQPAF
jgi:hypothetical protein